MTFKLVDIKNWNKNKEEEGVYLTIDNETFKILQRENCSLRSIMKNHIMNALVDGFTREFGEITDEFVKFKIIKIC